MEKEYLFGFRPINADAVPAQHLFWAQNPSQFQLSRHAYPYPEAQSHAPFLHQASYFGLMRQPYLVSLWQLDLERAETAEVPRWPKDVLKS